MLMQDRRRIPAFLPHYPVRIWLCRSAQNRVEDGQADEGCEREEPGELRDKPSRQQQQEKRNEPNRDRLGEPSSQPGFAP